MSDEIAHAILDTLRYADVFDYALTRDETHRYLIGVAATRAQIDAALDDPARLNGAVKRSGDFLTLPEHEPSVAARLYWRDQATPLWRAARFYARVIAHFPFVRMIAISGGLAMNNARDYDIDLLIVTAPKRLWLVRGLTVALVRLARTRGVKLCPNLLLAESALGIPTQDLYNAHELAQMVPLFGLDLYARMQAQNVWARTFLPNAFVANAPRDEQPLGHGELIAKKLGEFLLRGKFGDAIESWEMNRKIKKLTAQIPPHADLVHFSAEVCRGFFSGHGKRILKEYYSKK